MRRDGGVMGLYPLRRHTQLSALAESYSNVFLRTGGAAAGSGPGPVER